MQKLQKTQKRYQEPILMSLNVPPKSSENKENKKPQKVEAVKQPYLSFLNITTNKYLSITLLYYPFLNITTKKERRNIKSTFKKISLLNKLYEQSRFVFFEGIKHRNLD